MAKKTRFGTVLTVLAGVVLALTSVTACGSQAAQPRTLTVLAAASLTESFTALERGFEAAHPGVDVRLSFQGSSALAQQILNGAPADVFASADQATMDKVAGGGMVTGQAAVFARNKLTIVVPADNPMRVASLADLAKPDLSVVVCAPQVPCGAATKKVLAAAGITLRPMSEEQDVKAVLNKVRANEADAGLVYVTDAATAGDQVSSVDFPEADGAVNDYPIAVLRNAPQAQLAAEFVAYVRGDAGRQELTKVGFTVP